MIYELIPSPIKKCRSNMVVSTLKNGIIKPILSDLLGNLTGVKKKSDEVCINFIRFYNRFQFISIPPNYRT
jgi:hypothetical protein